MRRLRERSLRQVRDGPSAYIVFTNRECGLRWERGA